MEVHDFGSPKLIELKGPRARARLWSDRKRIVVLPAHHQAMHALHMHNTSFGPACRLCKRWLHAMMLSDAFEPEAVELLVASLYCEPSCRPFVAPSSPTAAFLRFLRLLSTFDWENEALCVDPYRLAPSSVEDTGSIDGSGISGDRNAVQITIDAAARVRMEKSFNAARKSNSEVASPPMFLVSHLDEDQAMLEEAQSEAVSSAAAAMAVVTAAAAGGSAEGSASAGGNASTGGSSVHVGGSNNKTKSGSRKAAQWTPSFTSSSRPSKLELSRTVALAGQAWRVLTSMEPIERSRTWEAVFSSPRREDYDAVLVLNREWLQPAPLLGLAGDDQDNYQDDDGGERAEDAEAEKVSGRKRKKSGRGKQNKKKKMKKRFGRRGRRLELGRASKFANLRAPGAVDRSGMEHLLVGFDPLSRYLDTLREQFSHLAKFFVDRRAGVFIGVVLRKSVVSNGTVVPFTAAGSRFAVPEPTKLGRGRMVDVHYDADAMLAEMRALGGDLVVS